MTGFQEAWNFRTHLNRCGKTPAKALAKKLNATRTGQWSPERYDLHDAWEIRANSGQ